jgi:hypothetical protein
MLLQYIHIIFLPHDTIYFVNCISLSCSKSHPQQDAASPVLHGWDGVLRLASFSFFSSKLFYFCFIRPEDISPKSMIFVQLQLQTVVWLFYSGFGVVVSSLLSGLSGYVDIGLVLLWK